MKNNLGNETQSTAVEHLYRIAEAWARSKRDEWWWRIEDIDAANEMFETAVLELVDVIGYPTIESTRDARLAAVEMVRSCLPGHTVNEMVPLEPDNLADAKAMIVFLTDSYAQLLNYCMPDTKRAEEALTVTAQTITEQAAEYAKEHAND